MVCGDVFIKFFHRGFSNKKMFRVAFNTHFLPPKADKLELRKFQLDPDKVRKKTNLPHDFKLVILFEDIDLGDPSVHDDAVKEELKGLERIREICGKRNKQELTEQNMQLIVFGDPDFDDREETMIVHPDESDEDQVSEGDD